MFNPKRWTLILIVSSILSLVFFIFGRLAMTDIYHGEQDLSLEWGVVSLTFLPVLVFHIVAIVAGVNLARKAN
jgi:hypothetical protein